MVARSEPDCQAAPWKRELREAITRPQELLDLVGLDRGLLPSMLAAARRYPLLVPRGYAALIRRSDPEDPLLRQILPLAAELRAPPGFCTDPLGEQAAMRAPGLLQKYRGRALLLVTSACAIHCRYCFRRHSSLDAGCSHAERTTGAIARLAADSSLAEVILSGGDPLMLDDRSLATLVGRLAEVPHLRRLRLHTRLPIVLPSRVTPALCRILSESRLQAVVVVHTNHAKELAWAPRSALGRLRDAGIPLLNQSVLLRGVNDDAHRLADLSEALFDCSVLPYYLHLLDKVSGVAHFEPDEATAVGLLDRLRALLPGYLVPRLVREIAGRPCKTPVDSQSGGGA